MRKPGLLLAAIYLLGCGSGTEPVDDTGAVDSDLRATYANASLSVSPVPLNISWECYPHPNSIGALTVKGCGYKPAGAGKDSYAFVRVYFPVLGTGNYGAQIDAQGCLSAKVFVANFESPGDVKVEAYQRLKGFTDTLMASTTATLTRSGDCSGAENYYTP